MNGAVYISFFQGQLESVLEQVVQLAVQEISKTVGSSLNTLLLETAVKEQENSRLRLQLQSWETRGQANGSSSADGGSSAAAGKSKSCKPAYEERADNGRTKPESSQLQAYALGGQGNEPGLPTDTRRLEQRGRLVDQLKSVMEQVLDFAVCELSKIVEASFDDLLLEITKMERERQLLEEKLNKSSERGIGGARRRGSENDSVSPSGSEDTREDITDITVCKEVAVPNDPARPAVLSVSQNWVPILGKVFGQKWCSDVWQIKELGEGGQSRSEGGGQQEPPLSVPLEALEPTPSSPQQDPRWTPLEDMDVFSPDDDDDNGEVRVSATPDVPPSGPSLSPTEGCGRRPSASMLQRLLTLPSQLLEDDNEASATAAEPLANLSTEGAVEHSNRLNQLGPTSPSSLATKDEEEEEEEEGEEEEKGRKKKRRRVWSECDECGRRFSRVLLLKAHRLSHATTETNSSSTDRTSPLHCLECGKRFSSSTRLHSHIRTQHPGSQS